MTFWRWATPKEYAAIYRGSTEDYGRRLLSMLETENPSLHERVLKELGRATTGQSAVERRGSGQVGAHPGAAGVDELSPAIPELGDDLLAGGA